MRLLEELLEVTYTLSQKSKFFYSSIKRVYIDYMRGQLYKNKAL